MDNISHNAIQNFVRISAQKIIKQNVWQGMQKKETNRHAFSEKIVMQLKSILVSKQSIRVWFSPH